MTPHNLEEFAQELRRKGNSREVDFADMILQLLDLETDIAEPFDALCDELNNTAPDGLKDKPEKQLEWVIDRSNELDEIYALFPDREEASENLPDAIEKLRDTLETVADILKAEGWDGTGDLSEALQQTLAERPEPLEYDL